MSRSRCLLVLLVLVSMGLTGLLIANRDASASEQVHIEGKYLIKADNETYLDNLQPGDSSGYSVVMENRYFYDIVYRITVDRIPDGWYGFFGNGQRTVLVNVPSASEKRENLNIKAPTPGIGNIRVNVSREDGSGWHVMTLRIKCQDGPLKVTLPSNSYSLGRQDPVVIVFDVMNIGIESIEANISFEGIIHSEEPIPNLWTVSYSSRRITLDPDQIVSIRATVRCPANEPINSQRVSRFLLKADNITRPFESASITLKVETIFDLRTMVRPLGYQKVSMGSSVSFNISVENWATSTDHVLMIKDTIPGGWTVLFDDVIDPFEVRFSILPGEKRVLKPYVYVPFNTQAGKKEIVLTAEGTKNSSRIVLGVEVERVDNFEIRSTAPEVIYPLKLGQNRIWFKVFNKGNYYDTIDLSLISAPSWMSANFDRIRSGGGDNIENVQGKEMNISSRYDDLFEFSSSKEVRIGYGPFQSADLSIAIDVPLTATPTSDVLIGIRYTYGKDRIIGEMFLYTKLLMVDLEIVDTDGNGLPDLDIWPEAPRNRYKVGDEIHFIFSIENDYPYPPNGIGYVIEIFGVTIVQGDIGSIHPGETKEFNVTWKIDRPTKTSHPIILRLKGTPYTQQSDTPSARSVDEIMITGGKTPGNYLIVIGFILLMLFILGVFLLAIYMAKTQKEQREQRDRERYEKVYGKRTDGRIRTGRLQDKTIDHKASEVGSKPSSRSRSGPQPSSTQRRGNKSFQKKEVITKKERSGPRRDISRPEKDRPPEKGLKKRDRALRPRRTPSIEEFEEMEEFEDL